MTEQLQIRGWLATNLPPDLQEAYERAAQRVKQPDSENTRRAYTRAWHAWQRHCVDALHAPLPILPHHLVLYLESLTHLAPNSVRLYLAALCAIDQAHALAEGRDGYTPLRRDPIVQRWLKSWGRSHPVAPRKQASFLTPAQLERLVTVAAEPGHNQSRVAHAARYARDRCMIVLGVHAALRVSELAALELRDVWEHDEGLQVLVRRSKTDQHGAGHLKALHPQARRARCPVEAFRQWLAVRGREPGPLFYTIARNGLVTLEPMTEQPTMRMIVARAQAAGLEHVTSHSMRATFATLSKRKPIADVMAHGGWASPRMVARYQRQGDLYETSPTRGLMDVD